MGTDLITLLSDQHRDVELMFDELEDISGEAGEQALVPACRAVIALVEHSVAEQIHLYSTVARASTVATSSPTGR